jgi:hypothetical protein
MGLESPQFNKKDEMEIIADAEEEIAEMFGKGIRPVVTVKMKRIEQLKKGLPKHSSWIPGFDEVVGTMGIEPYVPGGDERVVVQVNVDSPNQIRPRYTGPDRAFHGVVVLNGPIPPEKIEIIDRVVA